MPLLGTNTVDSRPLVYTVPAGRYRLLGYGVACAGVPVPGTYGCTGTLNGIPLGTTPARSYDGGEVPSFEVISGSLTDAGEFILEADPNSPISEEDALRHLQKNHRAYDVRIRRIAEAVPVAFSALGKGPQAIVPTEFVSKISCRHRPEGAMMYLPFQC